MVCRNFILPEFCKPCLFLSSFQFAKLIVPYPSSALLTCLRPKWATAMPLKMYSKKSRLKNIPVWIFSLSTGNMHIFRKNLFATLAILLYFVRIGFLFLLPCFFADKQQYVLILFHKLAKNLWLQLHLKYPNVLS